MTLKKIVIIGPESTGKSTLCQELATHFNASWVPEFAREYLLTNGTDYTFTDLYKIAEGQIAGEESVIKITGRELNSVADARAPRSIFIDTDLYVIKVWSEFVFNKCDNRILDQIATRTYDLYLLCNTDLPWEQDELREYPDPATREKLFQYYKDAMANQQVPWAIISGRKEERLSKAIQAVDQLLS